MSDSRFIKFGFDLRVIAAIILAAIALGAVNNALVDDEKRVAWSGDGIASDAKDNEEYIQEPDVQGDGEAEDSEGSADDEGEEES